MDVNVSVMRPWVDQLRLERGGQTPLRGRAITPEQQRIQELEAQLRRVERQKEILKKATVDSIGHVQQLVAISSNAFSTRFTTAP